MLWGPAPLNICSSDLPNYGDCCFSRFSLKSQQSSSLRTHSNVTCILNMIKMKKSYFIIAALAICTSLPIDLTSCRSKTDDEQEVINNSNSVMKMELSLSGDYAKFNPVLEFHVWDLKGKGMTMHTSTGQDVNMIWKQVYENTPFSYASAQIKGAYSSFSAALVLTNSMEESGEVSVHAKVFKDDKLIRNENLNISIKPTDNIVSVSFIPENGFTKVK